MFSPSDLPRWAARLSRAALLLPLLTAACSDIAPGDAKGEVTTDDTGATTAGSSTGPGTTTGSDSDSDGTGGGTTGGTTGDPGTTGEPPPDDDGMGGTGTTGEACDDQTPVELFVSPDDSNSMSSPVQVRETVLNGWGYLSSIPIRAYEFFNYYSFPYPAADPGTVAVDVSLYQGPDFPEGEYLLQVGVSSEVVTNEDRPPINVTLVLDTSGSMAGDPLERLKDVCRAVAASLKVGDSISMVTWSTNQVPLLAGFQVTGPNDPILMSKIDLLDASGGTDLEAGLAAGYDLASQVFEPGEINRLMLVSDGSANAGITDVNVISQHAEMNDGDGVYLVGVGVGSPDTYNDMMMDQVTDAGRGASVFIATTDEAWRVFNQRFVNTMMVAARDVQIRLDLPPGFEIVETSAEGVSPDPAEIDPQHLAPNDAMVFHQRIRTCAPELVDATTEVGVAVLFDEADTLLPGTEVSATASFDNLLYANDPLLHKGRAVFAYTQALLAYKRAATLADKKLIVQDALTVLDEAGEFVPQDKDLAEIRQVLEGL